jgi:glycosyltransferase involved in cell wall biosynthesis
MRILLVVLPRSPHSARLANLLVDGGWEVHVAPAYHAELLPDFSARVIVHQAPTESRGRRLQARLVTRVRRAVARTAYRAVDLVRLTTTIEADPGPLALRPTIGSRIPLVDGIDFGLLADTVTPNASRRAPWLAKLIDDLRPDVIHSFTIQQAAYMTMAARLLCRRPFPVWIVSNWGIDIHFFRRLKMHRGAIASVLARCDYYVAECHRDVAFARELGFGGEVLGVAPIGGGFDVARFRALRQPGPTSARRLIMIKGYQNVVGRALVALRGVELCTDHLRGYRVALYAADADVKLAAELLAHTTGLPVEILPFLPYDDLMRYHGQARISIGLSLSDAISTSALEAMVMGSIPIQSHTSCLDEWVRDGETGLLVHPEDPVAVAAAIRQVVADDGWVDAAVAANDRTVGERLDAAVLNTRILAMYEHLAEALEIV